MYYYNVALKFNQDINREIIEFSKKFNRDMDVLFELSSEKNTHISILKFESPEKLTSEQALHINKLIEKEIYVNLSGISFLPSKDEGIWVEISVLKSDYLIDIQKQSISLFKNIKIKNKILDSFRPHITLSKIKNKNIVNTELFDYDILRKKQVATVPRLGYAGENFEFYDI